MPGKTVADGLRSLKGDSDMVDMIAASTVEKNLVLFIDHVNFLETNRHDDVLVDGMRDLPAVIISPVKRSRDNLDDDDEVRVISPVKKRKQRYESKSNEDEEEVEAGEYDDYDSELDSDFVDSDYEIGKDDDDLYADNVDEEVEESYKGKLKEKDKGKEKEKGKERDVENYVESEDDDLELPRKENGKERADAKNLKYNFRTFRAETDMDAPQFKLGMIFSDVKELRKALAAYTVRERVKILKLKNDKKRLEAMCEDDEYPWYLKASFDNRT